MNGGSHDLKLESRPARSLQCAPHPHSCSKTTLPALRVFLSYSSYQLLTLRIINFFCKACVSFIVSSLTGRQVSCMQEFLCSVLFINESHVQEQSLAPSKPSLHIAIFISTCLPAVRCHFSPCVTGGKMKVKSHLVIY